MMIHVEQNTPEWFACRAGYVTASGISHVMAKGEGKTRRKYMLKLIAERKFGALPQMDSYTNAAIEHGKETEKFARAAFTAATGIWVDDGGWWTHDGLATLGASPDGLIDNDGLLEIKCPNTETHLEYMLAKKVPTEYVKQIQCQLWVTNRKWCEFVSYDPRLGTKNLFHIHVDRDEELIAQMYDAVKEFERDLELLTLEMEQT